MGPEKRGPRRIGVNAVAAAVFLLAAALQYNDPDPWAWIAIYAAAAVACVLDGRMPLAWLAALAVLAATLYWGLSLVPGLGTVSPLDLFEPMEAKGGPIEEGREAVGLLIIAGWMSFLVGRRLLRRPSASSGASDS